MGLLAVSVGMVLGGCSSSAPGTGGGGSTSVPATAAPVFSVAAGTYTSVQTVAITCATAGAAIYYTVDGSVPSVESTLYSAPIKVASSETLQAIALAAGDSGSLVTSAAYVMMAATPTFSVAAGTYTSAQTVTLSDTTNGAQIHYTTDGTTATASSALYSVPLTVSSSETVEAMAVANGYSPSAVASAVYNIGQPPVADAGGPYSGIEGIAVSFSGSASTDPQGLALTYAWVFGDGNTGSGVAPTHTYAAVGTYTVNLTVTDSYGLTNTATVQAKIGAPGAPLTGQATSGSQPVVGAHVYLLAARTTGYGGAGLAASGSNASVSVASAAETGNSDSVGAYVVTDANGSFSLTGGYSCTSGQQLYLYVLGGNAGAGANSAIGMMAAVGNCPSATGPAVFATVNEVSTVAAAYAMAGFATDATHVGSSGTALALTGIANAFANAANLADLPSGTALATTPVGNQTVPQAEIDTLANILASCVNSNGTGSACTTLFANAESAGSTGTVATDTATAAINIAHNPYGNPYGNFQNIANLYALASGTVPFAPALTADPYEFGISLVSAQPPAPSVGAQFYNVGLGLPVTLDASGSSDPQGEALTYLWHFGDGTTGTGATPTHLYSAPTLYTVQLCVTNGSNLGACEDTYVSVVPPPAANAGGPYTGLSGSAISFNGSGSFDVLSLTYAWNFGDGGTGTGVTPSHAYSTAGSYTVTLTVTSADTLTSTTTAKVAIANGGPGVSGSVYSGLQPISGAHVYLFAANTTGYGQPSVSLLNGTSTGMSDSLGAYVLTAADGSFAWTGDYSCTPGTQVYLYALGGNWGNGTNPASGLMTVLGSCPSGGNFASTPYIWVNEVSTAAAAYAMAGFATDAVHVSSSGTALARTGIANAFANAANLETVGTGAAVATTPTGGGTAPQAQINTLATILNACTSSSASCRTLLPNATADGTPTGAQPTDTATAVINIAHHPGANVASLYALASGTAVFTPTLGTVPNDFTMLLSFPISYASALAIDGLGNVWIGNGGLIELSSTGAVLSGPNGYTGGSVIAIDESGNAWTASGYSLTEVSPSGTLLSGANGYVDGYGGARNFVAIAIDGLGDAWAGSIANGSAIVEVSNTGSILSPYGGYLGTGVYESNCIAIDTSGDAWVTGLQDYAIGNGGVTKLSPTGAVLWHATGSAGGLSNPGWVAIDHIGNAWVTSQNGNSVVEFSNSGSILSGASGFTGGGLTSPLAIAIDGAGNVWVQNGRSVTELSNSGAILSGTSGYSDGGAGDIAIDGSGDVWMIGYQSAVELVGAAVPVVTPISVGVKNNTLGTRP